MRIFELKQFIVNFHELVLTGANYNDFRDAVRLLAYRLINEASSEDIEFFLKEESFVGDVDIAVRKELLRTVTDFDRTLDSDEKIEEVVPWTEEIILIKHFLATKVNGRTAKWSDCELYNVNERISIHQWDSPCKIVQLKNHVAVKTADELVRIERDEEDDEEYHKGDWEFFNLETHEIIKRQNVVQLTPLGKGKVGIIYEDEKGEILDLNSHNELHSEQNVKKIIPLNSDQVGLISNGRAQIYEYETGNVIDLGEGIVDIVSPGKGLFALTYNDSSGALINFEKKIIHSWKGINKIKLMKKNLLAVQYEVNAWESNKLELFDCIKIKLIYKYSLVTEIIPFGKKQEYLFVKKPNEPLQLFNIESEQIVKTWERIKNYDQIVLLQNMFAVRRVQKVELIDPKRDKPVRKFNHITEMLPLGENKLGLLDYSENCHLIISENENLYKKTFENVKLIYPIGKYRIGMVGTDNKVRTFGPDVILAKLNSKQFLLMLLAKRTDRNPWDINNDIWESISEELRKELDEILQVDRKCSQKDRIIDMKLLRSLKKIEKVRSLEKIEKAELAKNPSVFSNIISYCKDNFSYYLGLQN